MNLAPAAPAAPADVPPDLPMLWPVPDRADDGFELVARHRSSRTRPATADGRVLRRLKRRRVVERTFAWLKSFRRVATRYERRCDPYDSFVSLACNFIALNRLL